MTPEPRTRDRSRGAPPEKERVEVTAPDERRDVRDHVLPRPGAPLIRLTIDREDVRIPEGSTVLRAAELAGISVPSLCSHPELSPFGGCRLCSVEIDGMRGYPLACSTFVREGMQVTTDTVALRETRREILQLILSQHPASCLLCGEADECRRTQKTLHKTGVATGCRSCTNDGDCELQRVAEQVGVEAMGYPVTYRGLEPEHDEPFYDRDYNLCILCGRCVRMCQEVRGAGVLAFKYRGPHTVIGPAFGTSHFAAGCEFCGACVSVCPTGALADKVSKWDGRPESMEASVCPFCALGCRLDLAVAGGRLSAATAGGSSTAAACGSSTGAAGDDVAPAGGAGAPADGSAAAQGGQLCVRGRFCLPETTHHPDRARQPMLRKGRYFRVEQWDGALDEVAGRLAAAGPLGVRMVLPPDLTNESLYAAQAFWRAGLGADDIALGADGAEDAAGSPASDALPGGPALWSRLFSLPISLDAVATAGTVVVAGLDPRFSFSVVGVQVRRALRRGARLITIDARETSLTRVADEAFVVAPGDEAHSLTELLAGMRREAAGTLAIVAGPRVFDCPGSDTLAHELERSCERDGVTVLPLYQGANLRGALELGALGGVLPGPRPRPETRRGRGSAGRDGGGPAGRDGRRPAVLYLVGSAPFAHRPDCDYVIAQDLYLPPFEVDAFLPAASFAEGAGTLTNIEGRVQELRPVEDLPPGAVTGRARPDWQVFSSLAARLGRPELEYSDDAAVRAAIRRDVPSFPADGDASPRRMAPLAAPRRGATLPDAAAQAPAPRDPPGRGPFVLVPERAGFRHRGTDLADVVEGLGELALEEGLRMSPADMARMKLDEGDAVTLRVDGRAIVTTAHADPACPRRAVYASRSGALAGLAAQLRRVRVTAGVRAPAAARSRTGGAHDGDGSRKERHGPGR